MIQFRKMSSSANTPPSNHYSDRGRPPGLPKSGTVLTSPLLPFLVAVFCTKITKLFLTFYFEFNSELNLSLFSLKSSWPLLRMRLLLSQLYGLTPEFNCFCSSNTYYPYLAINCTANLTHIPCRDSLAMLEDPHPLFSSMKPNDMRNFLWIMLHLVLRQGKQYQAR